MRSFITICLFGIGVSIGQEADQKSNPATATALQETIQQWVKTEEINSRELNDWQADQKRMEQLLKLYRAELEQLDELLEKAGESASTADEEREQLKSEIKELRDARQIFIESLKGLQEKAGELATRLPAPLQQSSKDQIDSLADLSANEYPREITQAIIGLITNADEFNASIGNFTEMKEIGGTRKEVRTLYLGLAQAFYASTDGKSAGIGTPGADGWVWKEQPELAKGILRALAVSSKDERPDFVELPLQVQP